MNKKQFIAGGVAVLTILPIIAGASSLWASNRYVLRADEVKTGNVYVVSQEGLVAGAVEGDLVAASGNLIVTGPVSEDVLVAGGNVQLSGVIGGDARLVAGESLVGGSVAGDVAIIGGRGTIAPGATVGGDVLALGGQIIIDGTIQGRVHISGGEVMINGLVAGNAEIKGGRLVVGEHAVISGNLTYLGPRAPTIAPGAVIGGKTEFVRDDFGRERFRYFAHGMGVLGSIVGLLMSLAIALALFGFFKKSTQNFAHEALAKFWPNVGRGVLLMIGLPIISLIIMITIIGLPIGAFGLILFALGNILAMALSGIIFGAWIRKALLKRADYSPNLTTVIWGTIVLRAITFIPVIGWAIGLVFCSVGFGVVAKAAYHRFWLTR